MIPVYKAEKEAGLAPKVSRGNSLVFASAASVAEPRDLPKKCLARLRATASGVPDLHHMKSVLVSTGWNLNDDVFGKAQTWAAKDTPEDKPFNYGHDCADIIGHITGCYAVDDEGASLPDDAAVDELPERYHLVNHEVLYRFWEKEELQKRMDQLLAEIAAGKWFVSMECLFSDFDYAILEKSGAQKVIARNEKTAFLTKHLRAYGGDGTYQGARVGRLLKNFVFSGKGLVEEPANPGSVIFDSVQTFHTEGETFFLFPENPGYTTVTANQKEKPMADDLQKQLDELKAENQKLQTALNESGVKQLKAQIEAEAEARKQAEAKLAETQRELDKALEDGKKAADDLAAATARLIETTASLEKVEREKRQNARASRVAKDLGLGDAEAKELVETMPEADEAFDKQLKVLVAMKAKQTPPPAKSGKTDVSVLNTAEPNKDAALTTIATETARAEKLREDVLAHYGYSAEE